MNMKGTCDNQSEPICKSDTCPESTLQSRPKPGLVSLLKQFLGQNTCRCLEVCALSLACFGEGCNILLLLQLHIFIRETTRPHLIWSHYWTLFLWIHEWLYILLLSHKPYSWLNCLPVVSILLRNFPLWSMTWPFWTLHNICLSQAFSATDTWLSPVFYCHMEQLSLSTVTAA